MAFSQIGYYLLIRNAQQEQKKYIKEEIFKKIDEADLITIDFTKNKGKIFWENKGKEFFFKGNMYDLVKSKIIDGRIIFYCINDKKENELINKYISLIKNNSFKNKKGKASVKLSFSPYVITSNVNNLWVNKPVKTYSLRTSKIVSGIAIKTLKPPNNLI